MITIFLKSAFIGMINGTAEGMIGVKVKAPKSKSKKRKSRLKKKNGTKLPKNKNVKRTKLLQKILKLKHRGLRPGETRTHEECIKIYVSIPKKIRSDPVLYELFLKTRELGHIIPHSVSGDNSESNILWQDKYSNKVLSNRPMTPKLKGLIKQQTRHFAKSKGKDSTYLKNMINEELKNLPKRVKKVDGKGKVKKGKLKVSVKRKVKKVPKVSGNAVPTVIGTRIAKRGANLVVYQAGAAFGRAVGNVAGNQITKTIGKKLAKTVGKKLLKGIPVVGTIFVVGCSAMVIYSDPLNPWNWVSVASDIGTSFLGPVGIGVDIVIQSCIE